jgi:NAD-dependent dihydropyrimidine dehydrogenase PreA subunit
MFVDRIARGIPIDKFGDGTSCRDYTFVEDIVSGIIAALDNPRPCEVYNLGNNRVVSLNEFISVIEDVVGRKAIINQKGDQPGDVPITYADLTKSQAMLGYSPQHSIEQGMTKFAQWYFTREDPRIRAAQPSPPLGPSVATYESDEEDLESYVDDDGSSISSGISEDEDTYDEASMSETSGKAKIGRSDARSTVSSGSYTTLIARTPPPGGARFINTKTAEIDGKLDTIDADDATDCGACGDAEEAFSELHICSSKTAVVTVLETSH